MPSHRALFSSDWNQCLAPCGPFDCLAYHHPQLQPELEVVFKQYTGNRISLGEAVRRIGEFLPAPLSEAQMDAYLEKSFAVYRGVPELIEWCASERILFMINTTGMIGYFQRVFALGLLPPVPVLSAHPMIRYPRAKTDPGVIYELHETADKGVHTQQEAQRTGIAPDRVIVMGDSGGDGPHFAWAARTGARRVGSMTKASLSSYCRGEKIGIDVHFGPVYAVGEKADSWREMQVDFRNLIPDIKRLLGC